MATVKIIQSTTDTITATFDNLQQKVDKSIDINTKLNRRRNWINPRRYRSSGNARKA